MDIDNIFNDAALTFVNGFRDMRIIVEEALEDVDIFKDENEKVPGNMCVGGIDVCRSCRGGGNPGIR